MAIFGALSTVRSQTVHYRWLLPAFAYLNELFTPDSAAGQKLTSLVPGESFRRELADGNFALEQAYFTKPRAEGVFETHRLYVDVQVIVLGEEFMEVTNPETLIVRDAYNPARDAIFYQDADHASVLRLRAGEAAIYFPDDAHNGGLQIGGPQLVRKVVIKVPLSGHAAS
jgi:YhcH/YjgK/YiaL family protein